MASVGIRELRQNLSVYLRRVREGETLQVTERGRPVAVLAPLPEGSSLIDELVAAGRVIPAEGSISDVIPPKGPIDRTRKLSRALEEQRAERL
jgi:prevent-host-death family protein